MPTTTPTTTPTTMPMTMPAAIRQPIRLIVLLIVAVFLCLTLYQNRGAFKSDRPVHPVALKPPTDAANATLGFGAVRVVSTPGSPRRSKLQQAANVLRIQLSFPEHHTLWTEQDVAEFRNHRNASESRVTLGSVKAWLSHRRVLREFLDSGDETTLILEDDVDFDIRLRTKQIPFAQTAARRLFQSPSRNATAYPWGSPQHWDLLYIGHCGDFLSTHSEKGNVPGVGAQRPSDLSQLPHTVYADETVPRGTDLHPWTAHFLLALDVPQQHRLLHRSVRPFCSFGYAITRTTAEKLLAELAPAHEVVWAKAYDVALFHACKKQLTCYTLTPEIFHHMNGISMIAKSIGKTKSTPVDLAGRPQEDWRRETSNIGCGFWSGDFYPTSASHLAHLQREVGDKGQCLKSDSKKPA